MYKEKKVQNNKGFTLVELIVVLVILAILAAILVPTLLGYIDEAKKKQYVLEAKNILTATQSKLNKAYAQRLPYDSTCPNIVRNNDGQWRTRATIAINKYGFSYEVFQLAGYELTGTKPANIYTQRDTNNNAISDVWNTAVGNSADKSKINFVCVGLGDYRTYANPNLASYDIHKAYTAYFIIFQPYDGADPIIYDGNDFVEINPFIGKKILKDSLNNNTSSDYKLNVNGEEITIQLYILKCGQDNKYTGYSTLMDNVDKKLK